MSNLIDALKSVSAAMGYPPVLEGFVRAAEVEVNELTARLEAAEAALAAMSAPIAADGHESETESLVPVSEPAAPEGAADAPAEPAAADDATQPVA